MNFAAQFFGLLGVLFLLSKVLSRQLGLLIFRLTGREDWAVGIMAFLFLPGTVVHEFAHAAVAHALGVYVGEISLMPKVEHKAVKLGSVQIESTDPFRRFFIGVAPVVVGLALMFLALAIYQRFAEGFPLWAVLLVYYVIFEVGNGMFSSRRDMEGALELAVSLVLVFGILYLLGVRFSTEGIFGFLQKSGAFFKFGADALLKIVLVDIGVILAAVSGNAVLRR